MSPSLRFTAAIFLVCTSLACGLGIAIARQSPASGETECLSSIKQVGMALNMYVQDYDEILPPMKSTASTDKLIEPYVRKSALLLCPVLSKPYSPNFALASKALKVFADPSGTVTFFDAVPHADGTYAVVYLDAHVKRAAKVPALTPKFVTNKVLPRAKKKHSGR